MGNKIVAYLEVAFAEAEHLLHEVHSPKQFFLGLTEDAINALYSKTMKAPSPPPEGSAPATPDTRDATIASQQAQISALTAAVDAQIARLTAAATAATAPAPVVVTPPTPTTP
jgi:hypothetical protein